MSGWPGPADYSWLVQNPALAFTDPKLRACAIKHGRNNQPVLICGNSAVVFRAILPDGTECAVRAFIIENAE